MRNKKSSSKNNPKPKPNPKPKSNKNTTIKPKPLPDKSPGSWGSSKYTLSGGKRKKTKRNFTRKMQGGGWGMSRVSQNHMVGGSKKSKSYLLKGGWGEEPSLKEKPKYSVNRKKYPKQDNSEQNGGGWGGPRTVRYDINSGSSTVVHKYFKKYFC